MELDDVIYEKEFEIYPSEESKTSRQLNTEIGFISAVGASFLLNEETFESWDKNSLLVNDCASFSHLGLLAIQPLSKKSALAVELSGFHQIRQGFGFYSQDGYFKSKIKELNIFVNGLKKQIILIIKFLIRFYRKVQVILKIVL